MKLFFPLQTDFRAPSPILPMYLTQFFKSNYIRLWFCICTEVAQSNRKNISLKKKKKKEYKFEASSYSSSDAAFEFGKLLNFSFSQFPHV